MVAFYRALCAGRAAPAALREAQGVLLDEHVTHPYLWAPFQVVGHADVRRPEDCSAALPSRVSARHDAMELDTAPLAERRDMT
jgi:hypothetical protein